MTKFLSIERFICNLIGRLKFQSKLHYVNDEELPTTNQTLVSSILSIENEQQQQQKQPQQLQQLNRKSRIASWSMYLYAFMALISAMSMGTVIGWSSTALNSMQKNDSLPQIHPHDPSDSRYMTWIGSCITLGGLFGSLFSSIINHHFGPRTVLIFLSIPFTIGWLIISFAQSFMIIIFGRIITGVCVGIICNTAPVYVADIVTPDRRGFLGSCFQLLCSVGALFAAFFGMFLPWNHLALLSIIPVIISSIGMCFAPNSPIHLIQKNQSKVALQTLMKIRSNRSDIDAELCELERRIKFDNNNSHNDIKNQNINVNETKSSFLILMKRSDIYRPLIIGVMLQFFQQFSGINAIMFYLVPIFNDSGSNFDPELASIIVNFSLFISCLFSGIFMDFLGRRLWLFISGSGMFITMLLMSFHYYNCSINAFDIGYKQQQTSLLPLFCLIIFSISFACGYGPIPWMIVAEISPPEATCLIGSFAAATNWLCAFIITKEFEDFIQIFTKQGLYLLFSLSSFSSMIFVYFFVPETKSIIIKL